jgi:hypothetical protein
VICLHCTELDLRTFREHAKVGMGRCKREELPGVFVTVAYDRACTQFVQASEGVIAKREEWRAKK